MSAHEHSHSDYNIDPLPPPISEFLAASPEWLEACWKLGFNPGAWMMQCEPLMDWEAQRARLAQLDVELAAQRAKLDKGLARLIEIIKHNPQAVLRALGLGEFCDG